jgi:hypothetical protein
MGKVNPNTHEIAERLLTGAVSVEDVKELAGDAKWLYSAASYLTRRGHRVINTGDGYYTVDDNKLYPEAQVLTGNTDKPKKAKQKEQLDFESFPIQFGQRVQIVMLNLMPDDTIQMGLRNDAGTVIVLEARLA